MSELDNIDVFDFFNYPKILEPSPMTPNGHGSLHRYQSVNDLRIDPTRLNSVPDPDSDWLNYCTNNQ